MIPATFHLKVITNEVFEDSAVAYVACLPPVSSGVWLNGDVYRVTDVIQHPGMDAFTVPEVHIYAERTP